MAHVRRWSGLGHVLAAVLVSLGAGCGGGGSTPSATPGPGGIARRPARPDVLLITLDTTRADALGCYGGDPAVSPNLDRFAASAHLFERCETSVPQTLPSHTTILSGLEPFHHGVRKNVGAIVGADVPLVSEELHSAGWTTGAFVSAFVLDGRFGLARGFDHYDAPELNPRLGGSEERRADATIAAANDWLARQHGRWFLWLHLFDPHAPYEPPAPFDQRFPDRPYVGEVAYMDAQVGAFLAGLEERGALHRAVVLIAGDHGEGLGEHGEASHGILLYEATTRVPLMVRLPGQTAGVRHPAPVGLVDVADTIRELAGLAPAGDGRSLLPVLEGADGGEPRGPLYLESLEGFLRNGWAPLYAVVDGRFKYIESPRPELYDVVADPAESHDLVDAEAAVAARLRDTLAAMHPADEVVTGTGPALDADERAALLRLGYVAGSPGAGAGSRKNPADAIHLSQVHLDALAAMERGDLDRAAGLFARELEDDPDSPVLLVYLGSCVMRRDPRRAATLLKRAIELRPDFESAYTKLCELYHLQKRPEAVVAVAEEGLRRSRDSDGQLHFFRALGRFVGGGDPAAALADLDVTLERAPRQGPAWRLKAAIELRRRGDADAALADLEHFAEWSRPAEVAFLRRDPAFAPLRDDPRFKDLVERMGGPGNGQP